MADGNLNSGWKTVRFDQIAENIGERADPTPEDSELYVGLEHMDTGSLRVRRWGSKTDLIGQKLRMRKGDILFARRNAYLKRVAVAPHDGLFSAHGMVLRARPETVLPEFLPFFMQSELFMNRAVEISVGSLSPTINWKSLAVQEFVLPSMQEQLRLLNLLDAWYQVADAAYEAIVKADRMRRAAITRFFETGLRSEERTVTTIGSLPKSWTVAPLGQRYEVQLGKMMSETARSAPGQTPYLRNANVQWNKFELDDVAEMAFNAREKEKFSLRYGDILACEGRHVGKSAMWKDEIPGACYQKALHRLRRLSDVDEPRYLLHCLQYYSWTGRFISVTGETTIPHLPAERFRAMLFPFPPLGEQVEIAAAVDEIDEAIAALEERQRRATHMLAQAMGECLGGAHV